MRPFTAFQQSQPDCSPQPLRGVLRSISFILSVLFITSCGASTGTGIPQGAPTTGLAPRPMPEQSRSDSMDADPYFVESSDTVSPHGPHSITRNILQDRNGSIWLATWQGILRYDGKVFTNYTLKEHLRRYHVFSLLEDRKGNLWFGTIGAGAYHFDGKGFTNFTEKDGLASNRVGCLFEDADGNIWLGTDGGASRYNGKGFTSYTTANGLSDNDVNAITQDRSGALWLGTYKGINRFDGRTFTELKDAGGRSFHNVRSILTDRTGDLWIGGEGGLARYDGKSLTTVSTFFIGYIHEDRSGAIWVSGAAASLEGNRANGMGLYRYDKTMPTLIATDPQVFGITDDQAGNIWFGTMHGARRYDGKTITTFAEQISDDSADRLSQR